MLKVFIIHVPMLNGDLSLKKIHKINYYISSYFKFESSNLTNFQMSQNSIIYCHNKIR